MGYARIQLPIRRFPILLIIKSKLLRLRFFGGSHRILEWNLRDRHALLWALPACRLDTKYICDVASSNERDHGQRRAGLNDRVVFYFRIFPPILLPHFAPEIGL